jgi:phosphoesterase RecJ-like protein
MLKDLLRQTGASYEEGHQLINIPLAAEAVEVSVFFKENLGGMLRCSLRSKGSVDVAEIARAFGGGGHKTAAGFKCREPLEKIRTKLLKHLESHIS